MLISWATSLILIYQLSASKLLSVVDVLVRLGRASSLTSSWPSLNRLYYNWTCVLLIVDLANATVNISNVLTCLISFLTQNYIHFLWSIFSNIKNRRTHQNMTNIFICQKQTDNPKLLILSKYKADMRTIRNSRNLKITVILWSHLVYVYFNPQKCVQLDFHF